jgi:gluconolactonase
MQARLLASGLGFPEGPTVLPDGRIVLCDGNTGELLAYQDDGLSLFANTGGSPWGTYLGTDGKLYVNQGGDVPGSGDFSAVPGIQRVSMDGSVEFLFSEVGGYPLAAPNQSAFGPDGRLWITDSGTELDDRVEVPSPGRLFVVSDVSGAGEMLLERPGSYPNGIAFDAQGRFYWSESKAHRVCRLDGGEAVTFCQLPETHVPDGMAFAADGRLFVANTTFGGVTVLSADGAMLTEIDLGEHCTNVVFDGSTLYVTATRVPDIEASERTGSFWRVETDAVGLELIGGYL